MNNPSKRKVKKRKDKTPKWTSTNETEGPIRGAAQIENSIKKAKKLHKQYQHVCYERWRAHNLTSDQVHGHSTSNVVRKRLVRVCFRKFLKTSILEKPLSGTDLEIKFHNLTILLKYEA